MRTSLKIESTPSASTGNTIMKLALLGGFVFGSIYVVLMAFEMLLK